MLALWDSLLQLVIAGWAVIVSLLSVILPWLPLLAWVGFWLFGVNWTKLRAVLLEGAIVGVLLLGAVMVLVWGVIAPPPGGAHHVLGLTLSNFVGKTVYVTSLFVIMFVCGSVQLSGFCGSLCSFPEPVADDHGHGDHGHGGHGHDDHGHAAPAHDAHGHVDAHAAHH